MKDLYHQLILVTILITDRADAVPQRNQREGHVPGDGQARLSDGIAAGGIHESQRSKRESFGAEADAVARYDGGSQVKHNIVPPSGVFNYGNLMAGAQARISTQNPTNLPTTQGIMNNYSYGPTPDSQLIYNSILVPYSKIINKLRQGPGSLYAGQANARPANVFGGTIFQPDKGDTSISHAGPVSTATLNLRINVTGYDETQIPYWIPYQKGNPPNPNNNNNNWDPYTKPAEGEIFIQGDVEIQSRGRIEAESEVQESKPNWSRHQKGNTPNVDNNSKNWNPYTKPAEGEILIQGDGEIQSRGITEVEREVQENKPNWSRHQKGNTPNVDNNSKNWNPYTKPAEGEILIQGEGDIISRGRTEAEREVQENKPNWSRHQKGNTLNVDNNSKNWNPYTKPAEGEILIQGDGQIQSHGRTDAEREVQENKPNWSRHQKGNTLNVDNNSKNWNLYTKPAEGEILIQGDGDIINRGRTEAEREVQENKPNWSRHQKENTPNADNNSKNWNPYTKPAEGEILIQGDGQIQSRGRTDAAHENSKLQYATQTNLLVQSNGGVKHSGPNKATNADTQAHVASLYTGKSPQNWGSASAKMNEGVMSGGAKNSESSLYGNSNKFNGGYLNGKGYQANPAVSGNTVVQSGPAIDPRFGQTTYPLVQPFMAFAHPRNRWAVG